mmetsp:Transcript_32278/g.69736  ORF Transcript_32278/g.69736 Transcript_32278/m.69736 type:complete len:201 (-) Transcript_32278:131-733(-)
MDVTMGDQLGMKGDTIVLHHGTMQEKLAFSFGLQRSVHLSVVERHVEQVGALLRPISQTLMKHRRFSLGHSNVVELLGKILHLRSRLNLRSVLDVPELYWDDAELEQVFNQIFRQLELRSRVAATNQTLDYAKELVDVLHRDWEQKHGSRLEWIIILLIFVEVIFEVVHMVAPHTAQHTPPPAHTCRCATSPTGKDEPSL